MFRQGMLRQKPLDSYRHVLLLFVTLVGIVSTFFSSTQSAYAAPGDLQETFRHAAEEFKVPEALLIAISYQESRLSDNNWDPSIDQGYGYMHLVKNKRVNTLDRAASLLGIDANLLKSDRESNIRGGAAILRDDALNLNSGTIPSQLADWYSTVAVYSTTASPSIAEMYADGVFRIISEGLTIKTIDGETITLEAQKVTPNKSALSSSTQMKRFQTLPLGCSDDPSGVDYPEAINCIVPPEVGDCLRSEELVICNHEVENRPTTFNIDRIVIHDVEGTAEAAVSEFLYPDVVYDVSAHYTIDGDGNIYQTIREKDIAYQAGNYWYNQHSIGIEHEGYASTGYQWYSAAMYLASAKLVAYLVDKYNIQLDHSHIVSHGVVSIGRLGISNNSDPGPYWLWRDYLKQVDKYSQASQTPLKPMPKTITVVPPERGGQALPTDIQYYYLYKEPSTTSQLIAQTAAIYEGTNNIEALYSYTYIEKRIDRAGRGYMMYKINYGLLDNINEPGRVVDAWLAVPFNAIRENLGYGHRVQLSLDEEVEVKVYARPVTPPDGSDPDTYKIGSAPQNSYFISPSKVVEAETGTVWYMITYNHRQAWIPENSLVRHTRY